jgi:ethanolamine utilization protein EutA
MGIRSPLVCVDQIQLSDLDFIDIGQVVPDKGVVPVVVKSLVFSPG